MLIKIYSIKQLQPLFEEVHFNDSTVKNSFRTAGNKNTEETQTKVLIKENICSSKVAENNITKLGNIFSANSVVNI